MILSYFRKRLDEERRKREDKDRLDREQAKHAFIFSVGFA